MGFIYNIPCPMCGVAHGNRADRNPTKPSIIEGRHLFWEDVLNIGEGKPFGIAQREKQEDKTMDLTSGKE